MSLSANFQQIDNNQSFEGDRQSALVHLGQLALTDLAPLEVMSHAISLINQVLSTNRCIIWELLDNRKSMLLRTGTGYDEGLVPPLHIPFDSDSLEAFTLKSVYPIVMENLQEEIRFRGSPLAMRHDAVSGVSVLIGTQEKPYGFLEAFSDRLQSFSHSDAFFLQSIANVIALVMRQGRSEEDLMAQNQKLMKELVRAQYMTSSGHFEWNRYEIKNRLIENRERERLRLAQDLHDSPIQDLYGMIYSMNDLKEVFKEPDGENIVNECEHTLHKVVNSLRTICRELRPPSLSPFGLEVAIRDHVEKFRDQNPEINVNLVMMHDRQLLSDSLRLTLFRIYQQAMHNIARHAQATEVDVRFHWDDEIILLEVEDNGIGFEMPQNWMDLVRAEHFGLLDIAERVESIQGKLEIISAPGDGTLVRAIVPRY